MYVCVCVFHDYLFHLISTEPYGYCTKLIYTNEERMNAINIANDSSSLQ